MPLLIQTLSNQVLSAGSTYRISFDITVDGSVVVQFPLGELYYRKVFTDETISFSDTFTIESSGDIYDPSLIFDTAPGEDYSNANSVILDNISIRQVASSVDDGLPV